MLKINNHLKKHTNLSVSQQCHGRVCCCSLDRFNAELLEGERDRQQIPAHLRLPRPYQRRMKLPVICARVPPLTHGCVYLPEQLVLDVS